MTRPTTFATPIIALALCSLVWLSSLAPALAATVTDSFPLTLTGTERCRNDPKFFGPIHEKILDGKTLTFTRDVLNTGDLTDIRATINTHGDKATIDALTLHGRALLANKSGSTAQLVLSGLDPGNPNHFMTLRGQATFDKAGNLIKVTGTFVYQVLSDLGCLPNIDCFGSGTFATGKKLPPSGGGGTLAISDLSPLPSGKVGTVYSTTLVALGGTPVLAWSVRSGALPVGLTLNPSTGQISGTPKTPGTSIFRIRVQDTGTSQQSAVKHFCLTIIGDGPSLMHREVVQFGFDVDRVTGKVTRLGNVLFNSFDGPVTTVWFCFDPCAGASMNLTARTLTLVNTVLTSATSPPITLNGTLNVGGGTLTVANAPASVGGTFVAALRFWNFSPGDTVGGAIWDEGEFF